MFSATAAICVPPPPPVDVNPPTGYLKESIRDNKLENLTKLIARLKDKTIIDKQNRVLKSISSFLLF